MANKLWAKDMFQEYRRQTHIEVDIYSHLRATFPNSAFPKHANRVKTAAVLAVFWGQMATKLSGGKIDYIAEWRMGK